jgi:uncharacterized protein (AIM24 family)
VNRSFILIDNGINMVVYNIQTNGPSSQLVIEVINDGVYVEATAVAYIEGQLELDAAVGSVGDKVKAYFIGKKYFKPIFRGTGKIYLKPILGSYHKFSIKEADDLILTNNSFIACRETIRLMPQINFSLNKFLSGTPMINNWVKGNGNIVVAMPGAISEVKLENNKFVAFVSDVAAYTDGLRVTREHAGKGGWLAIAHQSVVIYRGTGIVYFAPHPNKGTKKPT